MYTVDAAEEQSSPSYCTHLYLQKTHERNLHLQKHTKAIAENTKAKECSLEFEPQIRQNSQIFFRLLFS